METVFKSWSFWVALPFVIFIFYRSVVWFWPTDYNRNRWLLFNCIGHWSDSFEINGVFVRIESVDEYRRHYVEVYVDGERCLFIAPSGICSVYNDTWGVVSPYVRRFINQRNATEDEELRKRRTKERYESRMNAESVSEKLKGEN